MPKGFDCATKINANTAKTLKTAGFEYVARYLGDSWKSYDKDEAKVIFVAGLKLISIFETNPTKQEYFTTEQGIEDALTAEKYANAVGQPHDTAIYFTVDYNAQDAHICCILDYIQGIKQTLKNYKIGLYGSFRVVNAVKDKVDYYWQTYAWSKGQVAEHIHMHQYENGVKMAGIELDRNIIKKEPGAWEIKEKVQKNDAFLYVVVKGDTLSEIAEKYDLSMDYLIKLNNIGDPDMIYPGQRIKLKGKVQDEHKPIYHHVVKGDTVSELAVKYQSSIKQIKDWNKLDDVDKIYIGQKLRVK